jgi:hypothetical protein
VIVAARAGVKLGDQNARDMMLLVGFVHDVPPDTTSDPHKLRMLANARINSDKKDPLQ